MNMTEKRLFLRRISLFESLSAEALELIAELFTEIDLKENAVVFRKGDEADNAYFVVSGIVEITEGEKVLSQISLDYLVNLVY